MAKKNKWKNREGVVFSTEDNYNYFDDEKEKKETLNPQNQLLYVALDKKARGGKKVTLVSGFIGTNDDLKNLGKILKSKCGVGGSTKENQILIQGNYCDKIMNLLDKLGYKVKRRGS
jgi:translation initiation factor 1